MRGAKGKMAGVVYLAYRAHNRHGCFRLGKTRSSGEAIISEVQRWRHGLKNNALSMALRHLCAAAAYSAFIAAQYSSLLRLSLTVPASHCAPAPCAYAPHLFVAFPASLLPRFLRTAGAPLCAPHALSLP